jgi:exopolyphosphatase/guanosine-5'-triphosphate,3'-diphosphate pyrophosphatase
MKRHAMPLYAAIDVGTNSVKLQIAEQRLDGSWGTVVDRSAVTRLGEGLRRTGELTPIAMERTAKAIVEMTEEARRLGVVAVAAVGTMGLRTARNRAHFLELVRAGCGVVIDVISGEEEAQLGYLAVEAGLGLGDDRLAIFDTGGGSTQFTFGGRQGADRQFSLNLGAVRLTEQFHLSGPVTPEQLREATDTIAAEFSRLDGLTPPSVLVGMGGTVTNLAAVKLALKAYDPAAVQGVVLDLAEVDRQIGLYHRLDVAGRRQIVGLDPRRADVVLAGACVVRTVMVKLHQHQLTVSDRGLRHGLLVQRFGRR